MFRIIRKTEIQNIIIIEFIDCLVSIKIILEFFFMHYFFYLVQKKLLCIRSIANIMVK